jgi:DUF3040 family protein
MSAEDRVREQIERSVRNIDPDIGSVLDRVARRGRRRRRLAVAVRVSAVAGLIALVVIAGPSVLDLLRTSPSRPSSPVDPYSVIAGNYEAAIAPEPGVVTQADMAGRWTLVLDPDGSLDLAPPPGFRAETSGITYRLVGQEFQTNAFPNDLCQAKLPGRYRWSKARGQLHFALVEDPCEARVVLFTGQTWSGLAGGT